MYKIVVVSLVILSVVMLSSCLEDLKGINSIDNLNINPKVALPLIDSKIFVEDFTSLLDSNFQISKDTDGTIILSARSRIFSGTAEQYFFVPDQTGPTVVLSGFDTYGLPLVGTLSGSLTDIVAFGTPYDERIDSIRLKSGKLLLFTFSSIKAIIQAKLTIPGIVQNGKTFQMDYNVQQGNNYTEIDLTDSWLNLTNNGSSFNELPFYVDATITANGFPLTPSDKLEFHCNLTGMAFREIYGATVDRVLEAPIGTQNVDFINNPDNIDFTVLSPSVNIHIKNSFGVPFRININSLSATDYLGNTKGLSGTLMTVENPFEILAPVYEEIGATKATTISINAENSNISEMLSTVPRLLSYSVTGSVNGGLNKIFILDTSKVEIDASVDLPLHGNVRKLFLKKSLDFDGTVFEQIKEGSLVINTENTFPLGLSLYAVFNDSTGQVVQNLMQDDPVLTLAAPVDSRGISTDVMEKELEVSLSEEQTINLRSASSVDLFFLLQTTEEGTVPVRITDKDYVYVHVGVKGKASL